MFFIGKTDNFAPCFNRIAAEYRKPAVIVYIHVCDRFEQVAAERKSLCDISLFCHVGNILIEILLHSFDKIISMVIVNITVPILILPDRCLNASAVCSKVNVLSMPAEIKLQTGKQCFIAHNRL